MSVNSSENLEEIYIRTKDESDICEILDRLKLSEFKTAFCENQINGDLLIELDRHNFIHELQMSKFEALKLEKFIHGWRPDSTEQATREISESFDPVFWSCEQVYTYMQSLNLSAFAKFCKDNQVNGDLLKSILQEDILEDIQNSFQHKMNSIEEIRLRRFVFNCWRPDKMMKGLTKKTSTV